VVVVIGGGGGGGGGGEEGEEEEKKKKSEKEKKKEKESDRKEKDRKLKKKMGGVGSVDTERKKRTNSWRKTKTKLFLLFSVTQSPRELQYILPSFRAMAKSFRSLLRWVLGLYERMIVENASTGSSCLGQIQKKQRQDRQTYNK
jgi:uncharacterized membrane protein YdbT with pleckstrin-like domain